VVVHLISPHFTFTLGVWNLFGTYFRARDAPPSSQIVLAESPFVGLSGRGGLPLSAVDRVGRAMPKKDTSAAARRFLELWEARTEAAETPARIVQARALILCAFPYTRVSERSVTRTARIGPGARMSVTFTSVDPAVSLPFGTDRALFAWMQTQALHHGSVDFGALNRYFDEFRLGSSGREYRVAQERLRRLESLSMTIRVESPETEEVVHLHPLKRATKPSLAEVTCEGVSLPLAVRRGRLGFQLDPDSGDTSSLTRSLFRLP